MRDCWLVRSRQHLNEVQGRHEVQVLRVCAFTRSNVTNQTAARSVPFQGGGNFATTNGTATAPGDFLSTSGKLTFAFGETQKTNNITLNSDAVADTSETFQLRLSNAINSAFSDNSGLGTIM